MPDDRARPDRDQVPKQIPGRFVKGQTGNPHGRPKVALAWKERCRRFLEDEDGWDNLVAIARLGALDEPAAALGALRLIAEYAYGKPQQHVDLTTGGLPLIKALTEDDAALLELPPGK